MYADDTTQDVSYKIIHIIENKDWMDKNKRKIFFFKKTRNWYRTKGINCRNLSKQNGSICY